MLRWPDFAVFQSRIKCLLPGENCSLRKKCIGVHILGTTGQPPLEADAESEVEAEAEAKAKAEAEVEAEAEVARAAQEGSILCFVSYN